MTVQLESLTDPNKTVVGNTIRIKVRGTDGDTGVPVEISNPSLEVTTYAEVVAAEAMLLVEPGLYQAFWTPTIPGPVDFHSTALVGGAPSAAHAAIEVVS